MAGPLIGLANHDPTLIRLLDQVLAAEGYEVLQLPEGARAYDAIRKHKPALIILDTWLESREAGWVLFQTLRLDRETREIPVLICSSDLVEYEKRAASLEHHGNVAVLNKPFDIDVLTKRVREMVTGDRAPARSSDGSSPNQSGG